MAAVDKSNIMCCLCGTRKSPVLGSLVTNEGLSVHVTCMVYSSDVWVRSSSSEPMFTKNSAGLTVCNSKFRPYTLGFGKVMKKSRPCSCCGHQNASLHCSVVGCNKSYHMPCALAEKGETFIFHAKMVYYPDDVIPDIPRKGALRPGRFLVCSNHDEWEENHSWKSLLSYIIEDPELRHAISIDVDLLPEKHQIAVSTLTQLSIVNPKSNSFACKYIRVLISMYVCSYDLNLLQLQKPFVIVISILFFHKSCGRKHRV